MSPLSQEGHSEIAAGNVARTKARDLIGIERRREERPLVAKRADIAADSSV